MSTPSRMYFFVMYNLSGIQKGIQAGHCALEYARRYGNDDSYVEFIEEHKTFILLDGGGSNDMLTRVRELKELGIQFETFREPDLNNSLSAIAFLLREDDYDDPDIYEVNPIKQYIKRFRLASN